MALEPAKLSDFQLHGALGSGATADVFDAVERAPGRPVAIQLMAEPSQPDELRERFAREALFLAGVESRHVTKVLGFGFDRGQPFLVLERLEGETLDAKLRRDGPIPWATAARWIEQLIAGVRDCHHAKVIHRDIKPSNIFVHRDQGAETVKLIDFGVARLREVTGVDSGALTSPGHVIGTLGYMAPEQLKSAKSVGFEADVYALGVVIFRMLTGRLPFVSRSIDRVIEMKGKQPPLVSSVPGAVNDALLDWVVAKAMARTPEERFRSARELLDHWRSVIAGLDEASSIGRVDESYAGRRPEPPTQSGGPATVPAAPLAPEPTWEDETDPDMPLMSISRLAAEEPAPVTIPLHDRPEVQEIARRQGADPGDPFEVATRPDADFRAIVERERELERARRRDEEP
jgi:serine/threonine-protein kinase